MQDPDHAGFCEMLVFILTFKSNHGRKEVMLIGLKRSFQLLRGKQVREVEKKEIIIRVLQQFNQETVLTWATVMAVKMNK